MNDLYDDDIKRSLDARLSRLPEPRALAARPRRPVAALVAAGLVAALTVTSLGFATEVNAAADAEGLGCADLGTKVQFYRAKIEGGEKFTIALPPLATSELTAGAVARFEAAAPLAHPFPPGASGVIAVWKIENGQPVKVEGAAGTVSVTGGTVTMSAGTRVSPELVDKLTAVKITCVIKLP